MSGTDLLAEFQRTRSERAFSELVRRYTNLVYSVVKRRGAALAQAQDVIQIVFIRLARSAPEFRREGELVAWLHRAAINASIDLWRSETRRRLREENAVATQADVSDSPRWDHLATILDEALNELSGSERQTILLRFFEGKNMRELGALQGVSEDAAKMRVSRALDRLRDQLGARGLACGAAALGTILTERAVEAAPDHLVTTLAGLNFSLLSSLGPSGSSFAFFTHLARPKVLSAWVAAIILSAGVMLWLRSDRATGVLDRSSASAPLASTTQRSPTNSTTNSEGGGLVAEREPDPRQLLRTIAQARQQISSGSIEFQLTVEETYSWRTVTNHHDVAAVFDGPKLRWETAGREYAYTSTDNSAAQEEKIEREHLDRATAVREGLLRSFEIHEVEAYDGAVWLGYRESNNKPQGTKIDDPENANSHTIFQPRCLGLWPDVRLTDTVESCLGFDETKSIRLVGKEFQNSISAWHVQVQLTPRESADFWIDALEPTRLLKVARGDDSVVSTYDPFRPRDPIPKETIATRRFHLSKVSRMSWRFVRTAAQFKQPIDAASFTLAGLGMPIGTDVIDHRAGRSIGYWTGSGLSAALVGEGTKPEEPRDLGELLVTLREDPRSESALEAATWILLNTPDGPAVAQAAQVITNQHLQSTNLLVLCAGLERMRPRCATNVLSAMLERNPDPVIRGNACFTLAGLWKLAADYGRNQPAAARAEMLFEQVIAEFGQIKHPQLSSQRRPNLAELAKPELAELRRLTIGKPSPNIEGLDLDGQKMALADYRGKVVLLVFWISGCSEASHLRKLIEELEGKPFVVIGVNCDRKLDRAKADVEKYGITWRSFWDGRDGPIATSWNVDSWADFWVLDSNGVIRFRGWEDHYAGLKKLLR